MVDFHACEQMFSCEECGKKFYLEWRFKKHASIHQENTKTCKYFHEGKVCPFKKVGCKFLYGKVNVSDSENEDTNADTEQPCDDNYCYFCNKMFGSHNKCSYGPFYQLTAASHILLYDNPIRSRGVSYAHFGRPGDCK